MLLDAIDESPPDILASSNYIWNTQLTNFLVKYAKQANPKTLTAIGGPNITITQKAVTSFLRDTNCDLYVEGSGEQPFAMIVRALLDGYGVKDVFDDKRVQGLWRINPVTGLAESRFFEQELMDLDEIPSPYLSGMADEFFDQELLPMLETNRGCPYNCTYCVWGVGNKVRSFSLPRIIQELDYCRHHAPGSLLMINDANFGLFDRDLQIAQEIKKLYNEHGWPESVVVNYGQIRSDDALKVAEALNGISIFRQSSQSMNPEVLKNVNRKNIGFDEWRKIHSFSQSQGLQTFGELILMLPGETFESYINGLRFLFDLDVDCINTNQLQLLEGARINADEERKKYGMRTKWRLLENAYGVYRGNPVVESVELVVETNTFSENQCLLCRPLNWLIQTSWTMRWHDLLPRLLASLGINPVDFFLEAVGNYHNAPKSVRSLFERFLVDTRAELFDTREELVSHYSQPEVMEGLRQGQFKKLNTQYCAEVMGCADEFIDYYRTIALGMVDKLEGKPADFENMVTECCSYLRHRFLDKDNLDAVEAGILENKTVCFDYDWLSWSSDTKANRLEDFRIPDGQGYSYTVTDRQRKALTACLHKFTGISKEYQMRKLMEPYYGVPREYMMFSISPLP